MRRKEKTRSGVLLQDAAEKNLPMSREEIGRLLGVSARTITNYARQGMPHFFTGKVKRLAQGAKIRFRPQECLHWIEKESDE